MTNSCACRAGTQTPFFFGETLTTAEANFDGRAGYCDQSADGGNLGETAPVGGGRPNGFGLYDTHGNVWEWCEDTYDADFYSKPGARRPNPLSISGSDFRAIRGGSLNSIAGLCRSASRYRGDPSFRAGGVGFRPVGSLP